MMAEARSSERQVLDTRRSRGRAEERPAWRFSSSTPFDKGEYQIARPTQVKSWAVSSSLPQFIATRRIDVQTAEFTGKGQLHCEAPPRGLHA
jgi:hypothetical protein